MASFEVTRSSLLTTDDEIEQKTASFRSDMDDMTSLINSISAIWEGDAHTEFDNEYKRLEGNLYEFDSILNRFSVFLRESANVYDTTEQKIQDETNVLKSDSLFGR